VTLGSLHYGGAFATRVFHDTQIDVLATTFGNQTTLFLTK